MRFDLERNAFGAARNAWTLLHRPTRLFAAEPCHPHPASLALDHPRIGLGLLALPGLLATGDPLVAFNGAIFLKILLGAGLMYLLVVDWTRAPPAGIVAGLLYAFHASQIAKTHHVHHTDTAWLLLALFFARRAFERGRLADGIGLGLAAGLAFATSLYALLGSALLGAAFAPWLVWHYGVSRRNAAALGAAAAIAAALAAAVLAPFLGSEAFASARGGQFFQRWSAFSPRGALFPGWVCLALGALGLVAPRRRALAGLAGDPRPAIVAGALLVALVGMGGNTPGLPSPWSGLARLVPGLAGVRMPGEVTLAVPLALSLLAGLGAAALLSWVPARAAPVVAAVLIAAAFADTLRPSFLGLADAPRFQAMRLRPDAETLAFFERLAAAGNTGPVFEVPVVDQGPPRADFFAQAWASAYHHRRTSSCAASRTEATIQRLAGISRRLPDEPALLEALRAQGFTTLLVHHPAGSDAHRAYARQVARAALHGELGLEPIARAPGLTAYAISQPGT